MPRKKALAVLEKELLDYLKQRYQVRRLQADTRSTALLGAANIDVSWDSIAADRGHRDTRVPNPEQHYTYSVSFDALIECAFTKRDFKRDAKGGRDFNSPSNKALKDAAKELTEYLSPNFGIDRLEVFRNGGTYFLMRDAGTI